jgi:hypothetical protein
MDWSAILAAVAFTLLYALAGLFKANEKFKLSKALATLIVGVIIGVFMSVTNLEVTWESVLAQLIAFGGLMYYVESIIKGIFRRYNIVDIIFGGDK